MKFARPVCKNCITGYWLDCVLERMEKSSKRDESRAGFRIVSTKFDFAFNIFNEHGTFVLKISDCSTSAGAFVFTKQKTRCERSVFCANRFYVIYRTDSNVNKQRNNNLFYLSISVI